MSISLSRVFPKTTDMVREIKLGIAEYKKTVAEARRSLTKLEADALTINFKKQVDLSSIQKEFNKIVKTADRKFDVLYHGTTRQSGKAIHNQGFKLAPITNINELGRGIYLTPNKNEAFLEKENFDQRLVDL